MTKNISVCLSFDFDAMSVWLTTMRSRSLSTVSRGGFGKVGTERLLDVLLTIIRFLGVVVYSRLYDRHVSGNGETDRCRRARESVITAIVMRTRRRFRLKKNDAFWNAELLASVV